MKLLILFVLGTLVVVINGLPPISRVQFNNHCRCLHVESRLIPPNSLKSIKLVPKGSHCPETEVIAGLVSGESICLNPHSSWVIKLVSFVLNEQGKAPKDQA